MAAQVARSPKPGKGPALYPFLVTKPSTQKGAYYGSLYIPAERLRWPPQGDLYGMLAKLRDDCHIYASAPASMRIHVAAVRTRLAWEWHAFQGLADTKHLPV